MAMVAEFEHVYPGLFREGAIGWRYFWSLYQRIRVVRARNRLESMFSAAYGLVIQSDGDAGKQMLSETQKQASGRSIDPAFVARLARMLDEPEWVARGYAEDPKMLSDVLLFYPNAAEYFPEQHARVRAEWERDVHGTEPTEPMTATE